MRFKVQDLFKRLISSHGRELTNRILVTQHMYSAYIDKFGVADGRGPDVSLIAVR